MREPKQSDSPSGAYRDVYPLRRDVDKWTPTRAEPARLVTALGEHEKRIRAMYEARWRARVAAAFGPPGVPSSDFDGCWE